MENKKADNFFSALLADLTEEVDQYGSRKLFPAWIILSFAFGGVFAYFLPDSFWLELELSTMVYATVLTLNGIILALSWSAFGKIYETIGASGFSLFLKENNILDSYLFFIRYVQASQMFALVTSAVALLVLQLPVVELLYQRIALAFLIGVSAYAIKQSAGAVTVMQDVVRHRATFDAQRQGKLQKVG